ncbi:MAG: ThuA domain-containing protein [Flavisolibacter sp.]
MPTAIKIKKRSQLFFIVCFFFVSIAKSQSDISSFKVIVFYTAQHDPAHISFVHEANKWFTKMAHNYHFDYDSTNDWNQLNDELLSHYEVVIFLDTRPELAKQRAAFENYISNGGAWMGFHFSGFALTPSDYPQNWDWYHNQFLGAGEYKGNTWRPTSAILRVEDSAHPSTKHLPQIFRSSPMNGIAGRMTCAKIRTLKFFYQLILQAFRLAQAQSRMKYGTAVIIRLRGQTCITK